MRFRAMLGLLPADLRRLARDELLVWMPAVPLAMALAARLGVPALLGPVGPGGAGAREWTARIVVPVLVGTVVGFMLLGEKEDGVWSVLAVTPVSLRGYLIWRAAGAVIVAAVACGVCVRLADLNDLGAARTAILAATGAPLAGAVALGLAAWATDTIQGFAAVKLTLIVLVLPAVAPRGAGAWQWPLAAIPSWWPVRAADSPSPSAKRKAGSDEPPCTTVAPNGATFAQKWCAFPKKSPCFSKNTGTFSPP